MSGPCRVLRLHQAGQIVGLFQEVIQVTGGSIGGQGSDLCRGSLNHNRLIVSLGQEHSAVVADGNGQGMGAGSFACMQGKFLITDLLLAGANAHLLFVGHFKCFGTHSTTSINKKEH